MANNTVKRILTLVLCTALVLGLLSGCGNVASTIRLEKFQGTVGVADEKQTLLDVRDGMQLYSGYQVGTALESLAWVSLDDTKSIKMDENTSAQVSLSGKDLKITLQEGKLFFDVSAPLAEDESFTIETATMITGIRGTSGWVEVLDQYTARVVLLEGTVTVQSLDPQTGETRSTTITGGQILTVVYHGDSAIQGGEDSAIQGLIDGNVIISGNIIYSEYGLRVEELEEVNIPDFVREEVARSPAIQEKITQDRILSVPELLEGQADSDQVPPSDMNDPGLSQDSQEQASQEASGETRETTSGETRETTSEETQETTTESIPPETEMYYEKVVKEETKTELVYVEGQSSAGMSSGETVNSGGTGGNTGGTTGGTGGTGGNTGGTGGGTEGSGSSATLPPNTTVYRPLIQLLPNEKNPSVAVVTHAEEITTYSWDANGNVVVDIQIVPMDGVAKETVPVDTSGGDWTITFKHPVTGESITLVLEQSPPA